jgi:hypothetical protein
MRTSPFLLLALLLPGPGIPAQTIYRQDELLASDRPEAWAMNYFAASSLMTSFGQTPMLTPGGWSLALDLGHIPRLGDEERRVGFSGTKLEDLNKSPVFGRLRLTVGLPGQWVGEIGYTPPVSIDGARPHGLIALAIGRPVVERGGYTLSMRAFGQVGEVRGDITCAAELAGVSDSGQNPFGCQAASKDRVTLNHGRIVALARRHRRGAHRARSAGGCPHVRRARPFAPGIARRAAVHRGRREPRRRSALELGDGGSVRAAGSQA